MEMDKKLYQIFTTAPDMLSQLLSLPFKGEYTMKSLTFKELEQSSDGILEPKEDDPQHPLVQLFNRIHGGHLYN